jgi:acetoin:2,6-dichlorophenolindophenol oxidoreductase subunit alpha
LNMSYDLGALADPAHYVRRIQLDNQATDTLMRALRSMLRIRFAEEAVAELSISGEAKCPCHLGIGQEAVAVGISSHLRNSDRVFGGHRSHSHYLALDGGLEKMMAEILGKETGASRGMGGSMHLYAPEVGFHGSVPIVGATIPIAAGAALAAKMDGKGDVAVTYFGDGACEEGVMHETLNMAAVMKLPCLFVVENNLYSSHLDIGLRQPANSVARYAEAHRISHRVVDGNDIVAVRTAAGELIDAARRGEGPGFLEAVTFRWRGHVGPNEDIDVGVQRAPEILAAWKKRDPVARLWHSLVEDRGVGIAELPLLETAIRSEVSAAVDAARAAPYPPSSALLDLVYAPQHKSQGALA